MGGAVPDTPVVVNQATTADAAADRLTAEAIGLLLEPLALDETLTGAEMLEVAAAIAERANGRDRAASAALGEELRRAAESIGVHRQLIQELREASTAAAVPLGDVDARACLNLLEHGASVRRLRALREVPEDALQLRRVDAANELRTLRRLGAAYAEAETRYLAEAHRSALKLDLDRRSRIYDTAAGYSASSAPHRTRLETGSPHTCAVRQPEPDLTRWPASSTE